MARRWSLFAALLALALVLTACADAGEEPEGVQSEPASAPEAPGADTLAGLDPIALEGPGEREAAAVLPGLLADARPALETDGRWPAAMAEAEPRLVAYILLIELDGQVTLAEVRADGRPHSLYRYYRAFDSGSLLWTPRESAGASAAPRSAGESAAAESVRSAMADAFPEDPFTVSIHGYRFVYISAEAPVLSAEVGTDGSLISVTDTVQ